jgi:CheY-like chemotaxis protein
MPNDLDTLEVLDVSQHLIKSANFESGHSRHAPMVLVVDDDIDNLVLTCHVLEKFACMPICETDGKAALKTIKMYSPDLIVLDILLPNLSGLDIIRSLKSNEATCAIPIIAVTALTSHKNREAVLCAGCKHYITKPYLLEDLEQLVHSCLKLNT